MQQSLSFRVSRMFSNYKNTQTGKILVETSPHGGGILFSDIYQGSISDSKLTEERFTVYLLEGEHEIMSDRGFSIRGLCCERYHLKQTKTERK